MYLTGRQHNGIVGGAQCSDTKELNAQQAVRIVPQAHSETIEWPKTFYDKSTCVHELHPQPNPSITSDSCGPAGLGTVLEYETHRGDGAL